MNAPDTTFASNASHDAAAEGYNFAYLDEQTKRMIRRALRAEELGETIASPTQDVEFMLSHSDNVEASGFVQHLKLPHYVDFQAELELVRRLRAKHAAQANGNDIEEQAA